MLSLSAGAQEPKNRVPARSLTFYNILMYTKSQGSEQICTSLALNFHIITNSGLRFCTFTQPDPSAGKLVSAILSRVSSTLLRSGNGLGESLCTASA